LITVSQCRLCCITYDVIDCSKDESVPLKDMDEAKWEEIYAKEDNEFRLFACALKISVSYAASIGGTGTLIGSGPNIVLKGQAEKYISSLFTF